MCNDYEVTIEVHCVPAENVEQIEVELWDILKACNQLPYDFEMKIKKIGEWL